MAGPRDVEERSFVLVGLLVAVEPGRELNVVPLIPKVLGLETRISTQIFERHPTEEEIRLAFYNAGEALSKGLKGMIPK